MTSVVALALMPVSELPWRLSANVALIVLDGPTTSVGVTLLIRGEETKSNSKVRVSSLPSVSVAVTVSVF